MRRNLSTGGFQYHNSSSRLLIPRGKERERERERREKTTKTSLRNAAHQSFAENVISSSRLISLCCCSPLKHSEEEGTTKQQREREREREFFFFSKQNLRGERRSSSNRRVKGKRKEFFFFLLCLFGILWITTFASSAPRLLISPHKRRTRKKEVSTDSTQRAVFYSVYFSVSL